MSNMTLKSIVFASLVSIFTLAEIPGEPAFSQEAGGCFMTDSTGRVIPLGGLCSGVTTPTVQQIYRARIKRRDAGTPVIDVTFNGTQTFEMIVDTGASGTLITRQMAAALGVTPTGVIQAGMADGRIVRFPIGTVKSINVNGAVVNNVEVAIAEQTDIGLLGHDFFGNYDVKIRQDTVEFHRRF